MRLMTRRAESIIHPLQVFHEHDSHNVFSYAAYRALESEQENALFDDPLAEDLAGPAAMKDARLQMPV